MGYIYKIINLINQKMYIGQTINTIEHRWKDHLDTHLNMNSKSRYCILYNAMRKYGAENFKIELVEQCDDNLLDEREQYWIRQFNSYYIYNHGYNMTWGGEGTLKYSDEDILKLWDSGLKSCKIAKILGANPSTISARLAALKPGEARKRHINSNKKPIVQYDLDGNFIKWWDSAKSAEQELKISSGGITKCCKKERTTAFNSLWKYANDETPVEELMIRYAKSTKCNQVNMYDMNGKYIRSFDSGRQAELELNITRGRVSEICNHTQGRRSVGGYKWEWAYPLKRTLIELK